MNFCAMQGWRGHMYSFHQELLGLELGFTLQGDGDTTPALQNNDNNNLFN